jgi:predicted DNA-binding transcriptional regulator YafY
MSYTNYLMKIERLVELIKQGNTGTADCLACKLRVSRRTIFRYFDELRMKGAVISYSKSRETFYLENNFSFTKDFLQSAMEWHSARLTLENK